MQFISRASIPFSLPEFTIVLSELWNEIGGWALLALLCDNGVTVAQTVLLVLLT